MKKLFLSLVAAIVTATATYAQSGTLAVLSHGEKLSTFYGSTALKSAMNAAVHGDVITLSSGTFEAADITKAVTIRGAGTETDTIAKTYPTILTNGFKIDVPDSISQRLNMEGIYHDFTINCNNTLKNATFQKCRFYNFTANGYLKNVTFMHCKFVKTFYKNAGGNTVMFLNCMITNPYFGAYATNTFELTNCVIRWTGETPMSNYSTYSIPAASMYAIYKNCIIYSAYSSSYSSDGNYRLNSTNSIYNCLGIGTSSSVSSNLFSYHTNTAGSSFKITTNVSSVFADFNGSYTDVVTFKLTDTAKKTYLGDDGTELGLYGGSLPYSTKVLSPQITKCVVAPKTTPEGKLSIDMEVKGVE